ncbi:hypothetical protein DTO012A9_9396 [Penicillium roqueforti]|nr:hypothetical protein DTO012A9_9396 [Penicillium roqueforti]
MHHADTRTFLKYYLDRRIDKNLPALIRGLNPDEDIMHAACRMSRTIDPNRPQDLTTVQSSSVNQRPEILSLVQRRDELRQKLGRPLSRHRGTVKYDAYKKLNQEINGARERARNALLSQIQEKYDQEQPMLEVQRQLSEATLEKAVKTNLQRSEELPPPQKRLIECLLSLPPPTLDQEMRRRTEAIDAVAFYCQFEEGETCRLPRNKRFENNVVELDCLGNHPSDDEATQSKSKSDSPLEAAFRSITNDHRPLFCFICLGQKDLDMKKRLQQFASHGDVSKHIKRKHLQNLAANTKIACNICDRDFDKVMHFQRHAIDFHSTVTGPVPFNQQ